MQYQNRVIKVRALLGEYKLDALLVSGFYSILYLTGFKTSSPNERDAFLLVSKEGVELFTDARYRPDKTQNFYKTKFITPDKNLSVFLSETIKKQKIKKVGFEPENLTYEEYLKFSKTVRSAEFVASPRPIRALRAFKDHGEIKLIQEACRMTDECLSVIAKIIRTGMYERELAWKIESCVRERKCDIAFSPIVASAENSAVPHYNTSEGSARIKKNSILLIDFGIKYQGYCSDITRMFFTGSSPKPELMSRYNALFDVQGKTIENIHPGIMAKNIDNDCRIKVRKKGLEYFVHSTGHGVGLEVHEAPRISSRSEDMINDGSVFTVEPGVYYPGEYGIRIEDTVGVVNGKVNVFTAFSKKLLLLGD